MTKENWNDIHEDFGEYWQSQWKKEKFNYNQTKKWINIGMKVDDASYCAWLRDIKAKKPKWVLNQGNNEKLKAEYKEYLEDVKKGFKLSKETIKQIKNLPRDLEGELKLNPQQQTWLSELISNSELRERYEKYELCKECKQPNTGENWCRPCNSKHLKQNFQNWTSSNPKVDKFIQEHQLKANDRHNLVEWIPYEKFTEIEYLTKGRFGKVYKAKWLEGWIEFWSTKGNKWKRSEKHPREVALKSLNNSQNIIDFLQEIASHKLVDGGWVISCYGISQDPETKNYGNGYAIYSRR